MRKEKGEIFIFFIESLNRRKLRVSESRSNVYIDYAEREQLHEGEARIIGESISVAEPVEFLEQREQKQCGH